MALVAMESRVSPVVVGTFFWGTDNAMADQKDSKNKGRPFLVMSIDGDIASCCPLSGSTDAWNDENESHCIPHELNEYMWNGKDSYFAVNRVLKFGWSKISVSYIQQKERVVVPFEFVQMGYLLLAQFADDVNNHSQSVRWTAPLHKCRRKRKVMRIPLVMSNIMREHFPS